MQHIKRKKQAGIVFLLVVIGILSVNQWQSNATVSREGADSSQSNPIFKLLSTQEARSLMESSPDVVVLDVRTPGEFAQGYLQNARNIDYYGKTFRAELDRLEKTKTYLVYCRSGNRSGRTLKMMQDLNFREVYDIAGGILAWNAQGFPLTRE